MNEKHCNDCKFFGCRVDNEFHLCNNEKSIFKVCLPKATACNKYSDKDYQTRVQEQLTGKTISSAEIDGFGINHKFTDGTELDYNATDGGYSTFDITELKGE